MPILYIVIWPLSLLYWFFSVLTWTARPLFALTLRYHRLGRQALPREDIVASNWVAACLLTAGGGLILGMLLANAAFVVLSTVALAMILPVAAVFRCAPGIGRAVVVSCSVLLFLIGLCAFGLALVGSWALFLATVPAVLFVVGWMLFPTVAYLVIVLSRSNARRPQEAQP